MAQTALAALTSVGTKKAAPPAKVRKLEGVIERMRGTVVRNREGMRAAATEVVHVAEVQGASFLTGMASGYWGDDKLKMFGMSAPIAVGIGTVGYGLYDVFTGGKGAGHVLALGNGVLAAGGCMAGARIGHKLAQEKAAGKAPGKQAGLAGTREVVLGGSKQRRF